MIATGNPRVILTVSSRYCRPSLQAILMIALLLALLAGSGARAGILGRARPGRQLVIKFQPVVYVI